MNKKYLFLASFLIVSLLAVSLASAGIFDFLTGKASSDVSKDRGYNCRNEGCGIGEGDCRGRTDYCMAENSFCHKDIGEKYGFFRTVDVCECKDGFVPDGNGGCAEKGSSSLNFVNPYGRTGSAVTSFLADGMTANEYCKQEGFNGCSFVLGEVSETYYENQCFGQVKFSDSSTSINRWANCNTLFNEDFYSKFEVRPIPQGCFIGGYGGGNHTVNYNVNFLCN